MVKVGLGGVYKLSVPLSTKVSAKVSAKLFATLLAPQFAGVCNDVKGFKIVSNFYTLFSRISRGQTVY